LYCQWSSLVSCGSMITRVITCKPVE
jgi:hypothetical protein